MILCIESSTSVCSVALCDSNGVVALRESHENKSHASLLTCYIEDIFNREGIVAGDLEAVAISKGPGSYTGLRIGVSAAKGIAWGASLPLIAIETTTSMFYGLTDNIKKKYGVDSTTLFVPMIDARRMEVYYSVFGSDGRIVKGISAEVIHGQTFSEIPRQVKMLLFGDGAAKCMAVLERENIALAGEFIISAASMCRPAYLKLKACEYEDVAYFEPFYLKDFIASIPGKKVIGR